MSMLKGKSALVTGSNASGIGRGMALKLAEAGANIVLNGFGPADETPICAAISKPPIRSASSITGPICRASPISKT